MWMGTRSELAHTRLPGGLAVRVLVYAALSLVLLCSIGYSVGFPYSAMMTLELLLATCLGSLLYWAIYWLLSDDGWLNGLFFLLVVHSASGSGSPLLARTDADLALPVI